MRLARPYFSSAAGCDPSEGMLESCRDLEVTRQPSIDCLPFVENSFDFITAVCVYHHVPTECRESLTKEARRILKPGGIFCIIEHNPLNPVTRLIVSRTPVDRGAQLLSARETRHLLHSAGIRVFQTRYFLFFPERIQRHLSFIEDLCANVPLGGQYAVFARKM